MKKKEKKTIEVDAYYSDFSGKKIEVFDHMFNLCVLCGKHMENEEIGELQDDGSLCKECFEAGYRFEYVEGAVGIIDKDGNDVNAKWL